MRLKVFFLLSLLSLFSCVKGFKGIVIPEDKKDYIGTWVCQDPQIYLKIDSQGRIEYKYKNKGINKSILSPIRKFEGDNLKVGFLGINTTFIVSKIPYEDNGKWEMVVDDHILTKVDEEYSENKIEVDF